MSLSDDQLQKALRMIESAEAALQNARKLLGEAGPSKNQASRLDTSDSSAYQEGESQIVEGVFDGQNMIGPNEKIYPVPANYASKSKIVEGDRLKLSILPNGTFLYKQIAPIEREHVKGTLIQEDGQFKVLVEGKTYRVLLASVTYYKGDVGDEVTLILPKDHEAQWGAIEAIIPQVELNNHKSEDSF